MTPVSHKKLFLLDLDGTLYLDEAPLPGAISFIAYLKSHGLSYLYLTNNSSKGVSSYVEKLNRLGFGAKEEDFLTSVDATVDYLLSKSYRKIYVQGTRSFYGQLERAGLPVTVELSDDIDLLLSGYDTELTYRKLEDACILLGRSGVDFVATNPDWVCPTSYGYAPDCGSVCEMLKRATGRSPKFIGKPQPEMIYAALKKKNVSSKDAVLIGDRNYTDIASAINAGIDGYLVLSGETKRESLAHDPVIPTAVYEDIAAILDELRRSSGGKEYAAF